MDGLMVVSISEFKVDSQRAQPLLRTDEPRVKRSNRFEVLEGKVKKKERLTIIQVRPTKELAFH